MEQCDMQCEQCPGCGSATARVQRAPRRMRRWARDGGMRACAWCARGARATIAKIVLEEPTQVSSCGTVLTARLAHRRVRAHRASSAMSEPSDAAR